MRHLFVVGSMLLAAGCATTKGEGLGGKIPNGASVTYALPSTSAKVTLDLVLESCAGSELKASPTLTITPVANPAEASERFTLSASELGSWSQKRDLTLELYENGTLKSVNAGASDRSGAILTNIVKVVAGLAALSTKSTAGVCTPEVAQQVADVAALKLQIAAHRKLLPTATPVQAEALSKAIEALSTEVARLRSGPLHITLEDEVIFQRDVKEGQIRWKKNQLAKWTGVSATTVVSDFGMDYCVLTDANIAGGTCVPTGTAQTAKANPTPTCATLPEKCAKTIVIRQPAPAKLVLVATAFSNLQTESGTAIPNGKALKSADVQVSQFGELSYIPLSAAFGGTASLAVGLDPFNKVTSYTFKTESRAENLTGSAAGLLEAAKPLKGKTDLEVIQEQSTDLEARLKLNKLRLCEEVIRAGGTECPGDKKE